MNQGALFEVTPVSDEPGEIEQSILDTVQGLKDAKMYSSKIKATCTALIHSARAVDRQLASGKLTVAATQMTKQILDSLDKLPEPQQATGSGFDTLGAVIESMTLEALAAAKPGAAENE